MVNIHKIAKDRKIAKQIQTLNKKLFDPNFKAAKLPN